MPQDQIILRKLTAEDKDSFIKAVKSVKKIESNWDFAFHFDPLSRFADYVKLLEEWSSGINLPNNFVSNSYLVGVLGHRIIGRVSIRHKLDNNFLKTIGGHIGYGVVPDFRNKGYAAQMLDKALPFCASIGIENALITCSEDNYASRKVIEKCGGIFLDTMEGRNDSGIIRRYKINTKGADIQVVK